MARRRRWGKNSDAFIQKTKEVQLTSGKGTLAIPDAKMEQAKAWEKKVLKEDNDPDVQKRLWLDEIRYWSNFFIFSDPMLERAKPYIIAGFYLSPYLGITKIADEYVVYQINNTPHETLGRNIKKANGRVLVLSNGIMNVAQYGGLDQEVELTDTTAALVRSNIFNTPWSFGLEQWAKKFSTIEKSMLINRINSRNTKYISVQQLTEEKEMEIKNLLHNETNITVIKGNIGKVEDLSVANQQEGLWSDWNGLNKNYLINRHMRDNFERKGERLIASEITNSMVRVAAGENEKRRVLQEMVDKLNVIYKSNIEITTIIEKLEAEALEGQIELKEAEPESEMIEALAKQKQVEILEETTETNSNEKEMDKK